MYLVVSTMAKGVAPKPEEPRFTKQFSKKLRRRAEAVAEAAAAEAGDEEEEEDEDEEEGEDEDEEEDEDEREAAAAKQPKRKGSQFVDDAAAEDEEARVCSREGGASFSCCGCARVMVGFVSLHAFALSGRPAEAEAETERVRGRRGGSGGRV